MLFRSRDFLIFERINTGSEKLNQMQIRKSLAHGKFISHLYIDANNCIELRALFSGHALKKDQHVEAYLRTIALSSIFYDGKVILRSGINNILNDFCEEQRQNEIPSDYIESFSKAINFASMIFENSTNMFRRVEKDENGNLMFSGNLNIAILESMLGVIIQRKLYLKTIDFQKTKKKYMYIMYETLEDGRSKKVENPFSTSTGTEKAIKSRFAICEKFFEE